MDEQQPDVRRERRAEMGIVFAGFAEKEITDCVVCGGEGTFDRLWPGNEEVCFYCDGTGKCIKTGTGKEVQRPIDAIGEEVAE